MTRATGLPAREFTFLWAAAILLQYISQLSFTATIATNPFGADGIVQMCLVALAATLLVLPDSAVLLLGVAALQLAHTEIMLPEIPNHRLFTAGVNAAIVLSALITAARNRRVTVISIWELLAPQVQALVVILYFFTALAKTNSSYLDASVSCATQFMGEINATAPLPISPAHLTALAMYGSLLTEWLLPMFLALRATRPLGIVIAFGFHFVLAMDTERHFMDFSAVMMAGIASFSDRTFVNLSVTRVLAVVVLAGAALSIGLGHYSPDPVYLKSYLFVRDACWMIYASILFIMMMCSLTLRTAAGSSVLLSDEASLSPACFILPLLAIANGLTPYLGLKTKSSWDMYSNMRLEGPEPNHLIFGGGLDVWHQLRFPVHVLASSNRTLQDNYANAGYAITPFELRDIFAQDPNGLSSFEWHGKTFRHYAHGAGELILSKPPSRLARKLAWFRPIDRNPAARCQR